MAATLVPNKGQLQAVRVLHRLASLGEDPVLFLAGDVPAGGDHRYPRRIVELAATLGVDDRVEFLGWRSDVLALIRNASAVLVLSESEGVPRVILEAMAIGVPVVATPVGGVRDLVCDGVTGWVVPADDIGAIAQAIINATHGHVSGILEAAKTDVSARFSPERQLENAARAFAAAMMRL